MAHSLRVLRCLLAGMVCVYGNRARVVPRMTPPIQPPPALPTTGRTVMPPTGVFAGDSRAGSVKTAGRHDVLLASNLPGQSGGSAFVGSRPNGREAAQSRHGGRLARAAGDNLFDRFVRVAKSNINSALQSVEDPEKVLDQAVDEMQTDLISVRQSYAEVLATQRRISSQKDQSDELAEEWYRRAQLAVEKGDDELAKEALTRRQSSVTKSADLQSQLDAMAANVDKLFDAVKVLEDKIAKAKDEKEQLIARAKTAKTTAKVNEMLSDVGSSSGAGAFDRMKEKVDALEARAEVSQGMLPDSSASGSLEDRFKALESGNAVDDELAKLKGGRSLPPAGSSSAGSALDKELEEMRAKLKKDS